jgi:CRP/FNR family transcriptional regulator, cyclic AMP receptor protein
MISPEQLRRYPYFATVSDAAIKEVAMISEEMTAPAGQVLFSEGDKADSLYILVDGEVDLQYTLGGGDQRTVDTLVAGDLLVWSALVEPYRCTATGRTRTACKMIQINGQKMRALCEADHDLGYRMAICLTTLLAGRLEAARVQLATA